MKMRREVSRFIILNSEISYSTINKSKNPEKNLEHKILLKNLLRISKITF